MRRFWLVLLCAASGCKASANAPEAAVAASDTTDAADSDDSTAIESGATADGSDEVATDEAPVPTDPDCNPLVGNECWSGFPANFWLRDDAATRTGRRLDLPAAKMPHNSGGKPVEVADWNRRDGFSPNSPVVALLPTPPDAAKLPDETRPALAFAADLPIVLLDAKTGAFIPFMAELDANAPDPSRQALIVRFWTPVREQTRVIVALTDRLVDANGKPYPRTPTFARLAAGKKTGYARIDGHFQEWLDDLGALQKAGLPTQHVIAAWHFDTASSDWTHGPALAMRDALVAAVGEKGLDYHIDLVEIATATAAEFPNLPAPTADARVLIQPMHPDVALRVRGTFTAPLFLTGIDAAATLNWQGDGPQLKQNGVVQRPFVLIVPPTVLAKKAAARLMLYGHGFLRGACVEGCVEPGAAEFFPHFVHAAGVVAVGTDWWGLAKTELPLAIDVGNDFSHLPRLTDKLAAGAVLPIALTRVVLGKLVHDPWLLRGKAALPLFDSAQPLVYYGNSLGGIMGTTMASLHPDLTRMVMNVAGGGWATLLNRSSDFAPFLGIIDGTYPDKFNQQVLFAMSQSLWDLADPFNFADHVVSDPFANTQPGRTALWPMSMGDSQVANLASGMLNRVAQVPVQTPLLEVWPLNQTTATVPTAGSACLQWDSLRGTHPPGNGTRTEDNLSHYATRWMPEFEQMIWRFLFADGLIEPRYCLAGGRDKDGKLPCNLEEVVPKTWDEAPPLPVIPPPAIP